MRKVSPQGRRFPPRALLSVDCGHRFPYVIEVSENLLFVRDLPSDLEGALVAQITDLHAGFGNTDAAFEAVWDYLEKVCPDMLLLTGDYIDDHLTARHYPLADLLCRLKAPLGIYAVFGNHDHRAGVAGVRKHLEAARIRLLCNESLCTPFGLWLVGVDDLHEGHPDVARAFADVPSTVMPVVLSHNPRLIELIPDQEAVILSGHTHGGQICLPFPTPAMVCRFHLGCRQVAGWYENGRARLYVSRGIGVTGYPMRYRCPAELALFRLQAAEA
ncbi:predicted phosphohydrolase [Chthonomonas calidirosea]|uniref:metallophosphoesterase n=1 Tax=Chthonomonas calidirosea TaxID=454171 RepID=UPI0006DD560A|nr:metallophosphoesterase [Chthonomonas calidirosea]CEK19875.1 predicted phosphohydrolase [Chthonomonas calidirosea]